MDYGVVHGVGEEAAAIRAEFDSLFTKVDSLISGIEGVWQGAAKKEFMTAYNKLKPRFNAVSSNLNSFSPTLKQAVTLEADTESQTAGTFHGF